MNGPVFDPGDDRSTTRVAYRIGRTIARTADVLNRCAQAGHAAAEATRRFAEFQNRLLIFGHPEYVERFFALARARSMTTTRSAGSYLAEIGSAIAAGGDPAEVLEDFARAAELDAQGAATPEPVEVEAMRKTAASDLLYRFASCSHRYPPGSRTCERCGLELT